MIVSEIITKWIGSGAIDDSNRPKLCDQYLGTTFTDVTGQPAENLPLSNNMYVIRCKCDSETFNQIESDDDYFVLWSEEVITS